MAGGFLSRMLHRDSRPSQGAGLVDSSTIDNDGPRGVFIRTEGYRAGFYKGKHYTAYVATVEQLKRNGRLGEAEVLLLGLIEATEREDSTDQNGVAPWYYEQLAIIYRKEHRYADEVAILSRFADQRHAPGAGPSKLASRLEKALELAAKTTEGS